MRGKFFNTVSTPFSGSSQGVVIDTVFHCFIYGNFKIAITMLYNKALRAYNCLMQKLSNAENIPIKTLLKLFYSVVVPVLLYGCEIWGVCLLGKISSFELFQKRFFSVVNKMESLVQLKCVKRILGVHSKSTNLDRSFMDR